MAVFFLPLAAIAETLEDILSMDLVVHLIDVGVGDAIFIELPDRDHEILIDGGDRKQCRPALHSRTGFVRSCQRVHPGLGWPVRKIDDQRRAQRVVQGGVVTDSSPQLIESNAERGPRTGGRVPHSNVRPAVRFVEG